MPRLPLSDLGGGSRGGNRRTSSEKPLLGRAPFKKPPQGAVAEAKLRAAGSQPIDSRYATAANVVSFRTSTIVGPPCGEFVDNVCSGGYETDSRTALSACCPIIDSG